MFGYYIEVRKTYLNQVPDNYVRKQTLVNAERFIVPVLKDREVQMLRAAEEAISLEHQLYDALVKQLVDNAGTLAADGADCGPDRCHCCTGPHGNDSTVLSPDA